MTLLGQPNQLPGGKPSGLATGCSPGVHRLPEQLQGRCPQHWPHRTQRSSLTPKPQGLGAPFCIASEYHFLPEGLPSLRGGLSPWLWG